MIAVKLLWVIPLSLFSNEIWPAGLGLSNWLYESKNIWSGFVDIVIGCMFIAQFGLDLSKQGQIHCSQYHDSLHPYELKIWNSVCSSITAIRGFVKGTFSGSNHCTLGLGRAFLHCRTL